MGVESPDLDIACVTALFTWWKVETYSGRNSPAARKISTVDSIYKSAFQTNSRAYNSDQHRGSRRHESVVHSGVAIARGGGGARRGGPINQWAAALHERRSRGRTRLFYFHFASLENRRNENSTRWGPANRHESRAIYTGWVQFSSAYSFNGDNSLSREPPLL